MAEKLMQGLHQDRDTITANCDTTRNAVALYFNQMSLALKLREKAVLNTVQKYTDIKLTMLDLHHQKLQEDHMGITKELDSLQTLLHQNDAELDPPLLVKGQMFGEELEVHQHSVLSVRDTLSQANFSAKFLSFSGDQQLSEPLKEAGALNECQRIPDTNILSMQRVVVSEHEDPYLHVPSRFEDLQGSGPQEEVCIDGRKKTQRVMNMSDMLEDDSDVQYQIPRDFLSEMAAVPSFAKDVVEDNAPTKIKEQYTCNGTAPAILHFQTPGSTIEAVPPKPAPRKSPIPPPRSNLAKQPVPPPRTIARYPTPQVQEDAGAPPPPLPPKPGEELEEDMYVVPIPAGTMDIYDVPRFQLPGGDDVYAVPRPQAQDVGPDDTYDVPRFMQPGGNDIYDVPRSQDEQLDDTYSVPRNCLFSPVHPLSPSHLDQQPSDLYDTPKPSSSSQLSPPPRPPKPGDARPAQASPTNEELLAIPPRETSPTAKVGGVSSRSAVSNHNYSNTSFQNTSFQMKPKKQTPTTSPDPPPVKPHAAVVRMTTDDIRSKPIPAPRPKGKKRRSNTIAGVQSLQPESLTQSAPPIDSASKDVSAFPWIESARSTKAVKTLPPKLKRFQFPQVELVTVLTSEQLTKPFSGEQVYPCGVCCSPVTDMLVVTDVYNHCIRLVDPVSGRVMECIGKEGRSGGHFKEPSAVVMDSNEHIFVAELDNPRVQKFTSHGKYLLKFGQKAFWGTQLHDPYGLALSPDNKIYVSDWERGRIYVYQKDGKHLSTIGKDNAFLLFPAGLVFNHQGNLLVADRGKHCVWVMSPDGKPISRIGKQGSGEGELLLPHGVAVLKDNSVAVSESGNHRISIFTPNGKFIGSFGKKGAQPGMFHYPRHMCINNKGHLVVADENNQRLQIFEV